VVGDWWLVVGDLRFVILSKRILQDTLYRRMEQIRETQKFKHAFHDPDRSVRTKILTERSDRQDADPD